MGKVFIAGGGKMNVPSAGVLASSLAVGSIVKLMENNQPVDYLVVHQGLPGPMYDASCFGCWVLRKDIYDEHQYNVGQANSYIDCILSQYLNDAFYNRFGEVEKQLIKQVKIPCVNGNGSEALDIIGYQTKIFVLSMPEMGFNREILSDMFEDGVKLSYFEEGNTTSAKNKRKATTETGRDLYHVSRSPESGNYTYILGVSKSGQNTRFLSNADPGNRPALILPSNALFDKETMQLKGIKGGM